MKRHSKDTVLVLSALQSLGSLRYLGAKDEIESLMEHNDFSVKKAAITAVGDIGDMRLINRVLRFAGVEVKTSTDSVEQGDNQQGSKEEVVEEGYSYEGAEERVDWGLADNTAENAEAKRRVEAKIAANKRAAQAKAQSSGRGGGGGSGGASGASGPRGGVARSPKELIPAVLGTLYRLSGEKFEHSREVAAWVKEHLAEIKARKAELDEEEKEQRKAAR
jgi:hypothetical protein